MHEYSVTTQIVSKVLREAESRRAKRVLEVKLQIGELTFLNPEQVRFWYKILVKGTVMEGSKLIIDFTRDPIELALQGPKFASIRPEEVEAISLEEQKKT